HRDVDVLPGAGPLTFEQGRGDRGGRELPGAQVGERNARAYRPATDLAGDAHATGQRLHDHVVRRPPGVRPVLPETGDSTSDHPWVGRGERLVVHPELLRRSGTVVLDDDIRLRHQVDKGRSPGGRGQVEHGALLGPVDAEVVRAFAAMEVR